MSDDSKQFAVECSNEVSDQGQNTKLRELSNQWINEAAKHNYSYHFEWLGRPIIQHPQDMIAVQQILWEIQPDVVIETGIARGGSLIYYASILELITQCGGPQAAKVVGIDIDIREHNRTAVEAHPMFKRIEMIQGSSVDDHVVAEVKTHVKPGDKVVVFLDSNHSHQHVMDELAAYSPLVTENSYCVVFDTIVEDMPDFDLSHRPWGVGDNPKTAVFEFIKSQTKTCVPAFEIDEEIENKILISVAPSGFLKRIR
jgi:cephalosporin hydroxylase